MQLEYYKEHRVLDDHSGDFPVTQKPNKQLAVPQSQLSGQISIFLTSKISGCILDVVLTCEYLSGSLDCGKSDTSLLP